MSDETVAERAALNAPPPVKGSTLSPPPADIRVHGWFIDIDDARVYRILQYAKQKAETNKCLQKFRDDI